MLEHVPRDARRILDLDTGDGRLLALLSSHRPGMAGVGLDFSELMLEAAHQRFGGDEHIELVGHDLDEPLPAPGRFDAVVSSMAIHHLEHESDGDILLVDGGRADHRATDTLRPTRPDPEDTKAPPRVADRRDKAGG